MNSLSKHIAHQRIDKSIRRVFLTRLINSRNWRARLLLATLTFGFSACAYSPTQQFDKQAKLQHFSKTTNQTKQFELAIYRNQRSIEGSLHVYIGGDGTPWITPNHKSINPTPRTMTALELMNQDQTASIYLGRPCYHFSLRGRNCESKWWTSHRYSAPVVNSLSQGLKDYINEYAIKEITLIGFSGGGTLSMLLASHVKEVKRIITINGNLDVDHWTTTHHFTPLYGSLNPTLLPPTSDKIEKHHLLGRQDKNIDPIHIRKQFQNRPNTNVVVYNEYDHHCCWTEMWGAFINGL